MASRKKAKGSATFKIRRWRESKTKRADRASVIVGLLREVYPDADCALEFSNAWELTVATILSAQCTDVRVNAETPALFARYPTIADYATADIAELEELVRRTGFFRNKARAIREAAITIGEEFGDELPQSMDELLRLRGVARKTANVVLGTAFGIASGIVVDTHVSRIAARLGLTAQSDPQKIEQDLVALIPQDQWIFFGHGVILHGRAICQARKPRCQSCRLSQLCPSAIATEPG